MEPIGDERVIIYGKAGCPFTARAREAFGDTAIFYDVKLDPKKMAEMLELTGGKERVPVIVRNGQAEIGFKKGS